MNSFGREGRRRRGEKEEEKRGEKGKKEGEETKGKKDGGGRVAGRHLFFYHQKEKGKSIG